MQDSLLRMGHRGSGANNAISSEGEYPPILENTLLSFQNAADVGAHFIEFDINLTGDNVPVIFHDFSVRVMVGNRPIKVPISSINLDEFKTISQVNLETGNSVKKQLIMDNFPTLQELFIANPYIGFDIEIKYPGEEESAYYAPKHSRNETIDMVLQVMLININIYNVK